MIMNYLYCSRRIKVLLGTTVLCAMLGTHPQPQWPWVEPHHLQHLSLQGRMEDQEMLEVVWQAIWLPQYVHLTVLMAEYMVHLTPWWKLSLNLGRFPVKHSILNTTTLNVLSKLSFCCNTENKNLVLLFTCLNSPSIGLSVHWSGCHSVNL